MSPAQSAGLHIGEMESILVPREHRCEPGFEAGERFAGCVRTALHLISLTEEIDRANAKQGVPHKNNGDCPKTQRRGHRQVYLVRRKGDVRSVMFDHSGCLILVNKGKRERAVEGHVPVTIVLIQHALECRARIFKNMVVQKHVSFFHHCCV